MLGQRKFKLLYKRRAEPFSKWGGGGGRKLLKILKKFFIKKEGAALGGVGGGGGGGGLKILVNFKKFFIPQQLGQVSNILGIILPFVKKDLSLFT